MAKKMKRDSYLELGLGITRSELEQHLDRKLTAEEWQDAKDNLADYVNWVNVDAELAQAINEWSGDASGEGE